MTDPAAKTVPAATVRVPSRRRGGARSAARRTGLAAVAAGGALLLAACGGGGSSANAGAVTGSTTTPSSAPDQRTPPGAFGTVAAITGQSMEVQNPSSGQTTVTYTTSTTFDQTVAGSLADITVGSCIAAFGTPPSGSGSGTTTTSPSGPVTADTVRVTQPTAGSCAGGFGGGFGGGFPGRTGNRTGGTFPRRGSTPGSGSVPPGRRGGFRGANGSVTSVDGTTVVVQETNPSTKQTTSVTVDVSPTATVTTVVSATAGDLAVGKCVRAIGPAGTTGAVSATSISISTPGPNGCAGGFAGRGPGGGAGGGTGAATSA